MTGGLGGEVDDRGRRLHPKPAGYVVAVLAAAGMVASFMQTILVPIQAELPQLLNSNRDDTAWAITITLLVSAICTPISGRLGDMYGKRRVALVLMGFLVLGSVVGALAPTIVPLIVGRGLQGLGMGVIPLGISILRDVLPTDRLGAGIALVSATLGVGGALGLPVSAYFTENFDWHVVFWIAAAIGVVVLALMVWIVPRSTLRTGGRLDVVGIIGLALGLSGVLLVISRGVDWGWDSPATIGVLAGGVVILLVWGWYELRVRDPLVDLRVSARGPVLMTNLASIAMGFAFFAANIAYPQILEMPVEHGGLGLSLMEASLIIMPSGLTMLAMSPLAGRLERRWGAKPVLVAGALVIAVAYAITVFVQPEVWTYLAINVLIGVGIGFGFAAMPTLIMQAVPASETGAANGLNTLMRSLGTSTASAVIAAVLARSAIDVGGVAVPSPDSFQTAFVIGLVVALMSAGLAAFIPKIRHRPGEHESLPGGTL